MGDDKESKIDVDDDKAQSEQDSDSDQAKKKLKRDMMNHTTVMNRLESMPTVLTMHQRFFINPKTREEDGNRRTIIPDQCWFHFPQHVYRHLVEEYLANLRFLVMIDLKITEDTTNIHNLPMTSQRSNHLTGFISYSERERITYT